MRQVAFLATAVLALASLRPAVAQDVGPIGIAVAAQPEAGSGVCFTAEAGEGFSCAKQKCAAQTGGSPEDCLEVFWCLPSLWSADIAVLNADGFSYHTYVCGAQSREELVALGKSRCGSLEGEIDACLFGRSWDPDGNEVDITEELRPPFGAD